MFFTSWNKNAGGQRQSKLAGNGGKATNTTAQLRRRTTYSRACRVLATVQEKPRVAAMPPASAVEQSFKEAYLQGHQTAQRGKTERSRAGAEASAHECVTNFTRRFQDYSGGLGTVSSNTFSLHRHPYLKHTTTLGLLNCIVIIH